MSDFDDIIKKIKEQFNINELNNSENLIQLIKLLSTMEENLKFEFGNIELNYSESIQKINAWHDEVINLNSINYDQEIIKIDEDSKKIKENYNQALKDLQLEFNNKKTKQDNDNLAYNTNSDKKKQEIKINNDRILFDIDKEHKETLEELDKKLVLINENYNNALTDVDEANNLKKIEINLKKEQLKKLLEDSNITNAENESIFNANQNSYFKTIKKEYQLITTKLNRKVNERKKIFINYQDQVINFYDEVIKPLEEKKAIRKSELKINLEELNEELNKEEEIINNDFQLIQSKFEDLKRDLVRKNTNETNNINSKLSVQKKSIENTKNEYEAIFNEQNAKALDKNAKDEIHLEYTRKMKKKDFELGKIVLSNKIENNNNRKKFQKELFTLETDYLKAIYEWRVKVTKNNAEFETKKNTLKNNYNLVEKNINLEIDKLKKIKELYVLSLKDGNLVELEGLNYLMTQSNIIQELKISSLSLDTDYQIRDFKYQNFCNSNKYQIDLLKLDLEEKLLSIHSDYEIRRIREKQQHQSFLISDKKKFAQNIYNLNIDYRKKIFTALNRSIITEDKKHELDSNFLYKQVKIYLEQGILETEFNYKNDLRNINQLKSSLKINSRNFVSVTEIKKFEKLNEANIIRTNDFCKLLNSLTKFLNEIFYELSLIIDSLGKISSITLIKSTSLSLLLISDFIKDHVLYIFNIFSYQQFTDEDTIAVSSSEMNLIQRFEEDLFEENLNALNLYKEKLEDNIEEYKIPFSSFPVKYEYLKKYSEDLLKVEDVSERHILQKLNQSELKRLNQRQTIFDLLLINVQAKLEDTIQKIEKLQSDHLKKNDVNKVTISSHKKEVVSLDIKNSFALLISKFDQMTSFYKNYLEVINNEPFISEGFITKNKQEYSPKITKYFAEITKIANKICYNSILKLNNRTIDIQYFLSESKKGLEKELSLIRGALTDDKLQATNEYIISRNKLKSDLTSLKNYHERYHLIENIAFNKKSNEEKNEINNTLNKIKDEKNEESKNSNILKLNELSIINRVTLEEKNDKLVENRKTDSLIASINKKLSQNKKNLLIYKNVIKDKEEENVVSYIEKKKKVFKRYSKERAIYEKNITENARKIQAEKLIFEVKLENNRKFFASEITNLESKNLLNYSIQSKKNNRLLTKDLHLLKKSYNYKKRHLV
ncbi:MAG: hypothetical protein LBV58_00135 [Acholeplasmatales bacterium]|jgi:hypothetical protein|nr:hypothetical protein [Acholeplasmatales bacterium]